MRPIKIDVSGECSYDFENANPELKFSGFDVGNTMKKFAEIQRDMQRPVGQSNDDGNPMLPPTKLPEGFVSDICKTIVDRKGVKVHTSNTAYFVTEEFEKYDIGNDETGYYSNTPDCTKLVSGLSIEAWRENYVKSLRGDVCENLQADWSKTMRKLYKDYDVLKEGKDEQAFLDRKQSILNLCWNPEIPFNESNQLFGKERVERLRNTWELLDCRTSTYTESSESLNECDYAMSPIYFIAGVTSDDGHIALAAATSADLNPIIIDSEHESTLDVFGDDRITVLMTMVNKSKKDMYIEKFKKFLYFGDTPAPSLTNAFDQPMIMQVIKTIRNVTDIDSNKFYTLYSGSAKNYVPELTYSTVKMILKVAKSELSEDVVTVHEALDFDEQGTMIIYRSHSGSLDFGQEINNASKFCKIYKQTGDMDGLKYEVCKLYFFFMWLDKEINKPNADKDPERYKDIVDCKRICTNVFSQNLKEIIKREPEFVFAEYYNKTTFGGAIRITQNTFKYTLGAMLKLIFKK